MAQSFLHDLRVDIQPERGRRPGVTDALNTNGLKSDLFGLLLDPSREGGGRGQRAVVLCAYIDTGVAHGWVDEEGQEVFYVSGHSTARPGDGALQYGRWIDFGDDVWANQGHTTGCTLVVPEPEPWMEIIPFGGHLIGHNFPPEEGIEYQLPGGEWTLAGQANSEGDLGILDVFVPGTIAPGDVVGLRSAVDPTIIKQITVVDLCYDSLDTNWAEGRAVGLSSDQLLFCYEADCINPDAGGTTWSVEPLANGIVIDLGNIPSFINYFDDDGDAQQVVDPYFLP